MFPSGSLPKAFSEILGVRLMREYHYFGPWDANRLRALPCRKSKVTLALLKGNARQTVIVPMRRAQEEVIDMRQLLQLRYTRYCVLNAFSLPRPASDYSGAIRPVSHLSFHTTRPRRPRLNPYDSISNNCNHYIHL
jgi:hypothetical protein